MAWGQGDAFAAVIVGRRDGALAEAVALAGGRVTATSGWDEPPPHAPGALLLLDTAGVDDDLLDAALPAMAGRADLVSCTLPQLDLVAGAMLLTDAQFLCEPDMAECVAALAASAALVRAGAAVREGDATRLARFSQEVGRIAGVLARLAAAEGETALADRRPVFDAGPAEAAPDPQAIRGALRARRLRDGFFGAGLFEDPAWDMLLDLFAAELEDAHVSISSLCIAAAVAPTTALRWLNRLVTDGLLERRPDPQDRRRAFVALSPRGAGAMRGYLAALRRAGLAIG
ncbi:MarR family transcriptional regulator [uncultured Sphingomonas sp.]|uniref:MarR family transcriptional regulator n=1 Tax=uncultured Sphingomonas sp. TaxID=158754 RepID=UPI0035C98E9F